MARSRRRSPLYLTVKWLVIPAGFFLLGFYVLGPKLGSTGAEMLAKLTQRHREEAAQQAAAEAPDRPKYEGPPEVDVGDPPR
ncbi:MAG: hypothetical protein N2109_04075 [Fimbriimonadales bacterium]|nr:hypothetical protein [Fimbriimonadales bacterium]